MKKLIGISGKMHAGKDATAALFKEVLPEFEIVRFSGKLKLILELLTGVPSEDWNNPEVKERSLGEDWDGMTVRQFMQKLGTNAVRDNLHTNAWVNALFADYVNDSFWIVPDTRFPNEFEAIKKRGGIVIRVERPGISSNDHPSETALDSFKFDYTIHNTGSLDDLRARVFEILTDISEPIGAYAD